MIDFTARQPHYLDHLAPIWRALDESERGVFYVPRDLLEHASRRGVTATAYEGAQPPWSGDGPIVVAASQDERRTHGSGRPVVFCAHGCGQAFDSADGLMHKSYTGGRGRQGVALFLAPNDYAAARWRRGYPGTPVEVVGCPKLDDAPREQGARPGPACISFHWPGPVCPEAGTAWPHYRDHLAELARSVDLIGHGHPRMARYIRPAMEAAGIRYVEGFDEVLATASVYVNDCSSTLYEFAAVGGPVVVLNAPWFRRQIHHGLRFWEYADVGVQVEHPSQLLDAIATARRDPPAIATRRREVVRAVYPVEHAAETAAAAIRSLNRRAAAA